MQRIETCFAPAFDCASAVIARADVFDFSKDARAICSGVSGVGLAAGATGSATPTTTIAGCNTTLSNVEGLRIDQSGSIFVVNQTFTGTGYIDSRVSFPRSTFGNATLAAVLTCTAWTNAGAELAILSAGYTSPG